MAIAVRCGLAAPGAQALKVEAEAFFEPGAGEAKADGDKPEGNEAAAEEPPAKA